MPYRFHPDGTATLTEHPPFPTYWAWSERANRWIGMTFVEHAADLGNSPLSITEIPQLIAGVGRG